MAKTNLKKIKTFADVCKATGKDEANYTLPETATNEEKAIMCQKRLALIAKAFNGKEAVNFTDTNQWKHTPWYRIILDANEPWGFRLSFLGCGCDHGLAYLGARPPFLREEDAVYVGEQFVKEFEAWYYYQDLAYKEI